MSTVNNTGSIQDPNAVTPTTPGVTTDTIQPADTSYYQSDIAPAAANTTTTLGTVASPSTPSLSRPDGKISISEYSQVMMEVIRKFTESSYDDDINDIAIAQKFNQSVFADVMALNALIEWANKLDAFSDSIQTEYASQVDSLNQQINHYNDLLYSAQDKAAIKSVQDAQKALDDAKAAVTDVTEKLANGNATQADLDAANAAQTAANATYLTTVDNYNRYVDQKNANLANVVADYNTNFVQKFGDQIKTLSDMLNQYNGLAAAAGGGGIAPPPQPTAITVAGYTWQKITADPPPTDASFTRPAALGTFSATAPVADIKAQNELIQVMIDSAFDLLYIAFKNMSTFLSANQASVDYYQDKLKLNKISTNPMVEQEAVQAATNRLATANQSNGTPSGTDYLNLFAQYVTQTVPADQKSTFTKAQQATAESILKMVSAQYLVSSGIFAGKAAVKLLGDNLNQITPDKSASKIATTVGFGNELQKLSNFGIYEDGVNGTLNEAGITPTPTVVNKTVGDLQLTGALMTLFQAAKALGTPDLVKQMVAAAGGTAHPEINALLQQPAQGTVGDALNDAVSQEQVKTTLTQVLTQQTGKSAVESEKTIFAAIAKAVVASKKANPEQLQQAIASALREQNVDPKLSDQLASTAISILQDEIAHPELLQALNKPALDKLVLADPLFTDVSITKAVNNVLLNNPKISSQKEFRNELVQEFQLTGVKPEDALAKANLVLSHLNDFTSKPTQKSAGKTPVTADDLKDQVSNDTIRLLRKELGVVPSHELSHELTTLLFGDNHTSVINILRDSISNSQKAATKEERSKLADRMEVYLAPKVELYAFAQALMDPANNILYSGATGVMYQKNEPSNFKKSIDVQI